MKRGKNMKGEQALDIVKDLGGDIPKAEHAVFSALVDDSKKMETRMTALEKTVSEVKADVRDIKKNQSDIYKNVNDIQITVQHLVEQVEKVINEKQSFWKFLSILITEKKFWVWLIILTLLIFGVTEADLLKFIK